MDKRVISAVLAAVIVGSIVTYWYWSSISRKPFNLRYGYPPHSDSAPLYVAVEMGFFKEENLNVSLTKMPAGAQIIEAGAAGSLDGGYVNVISALLAFEEGLDLRICGGMSYYDKEHDATAIVVSMNSTIQSIKDLRGKTVAIHTLGPGAILGWDATLRRYGLTLEDLHMVVMSQSAMFEAIVAGRADAGNLIEPFLTPALESGKVRIISSVWTEIFPDHKFQIGITFFLKSFIDEHKEVVDAFVRAYGKAIDWINGHPQETREIIARWTGIDPELTKKMVIQGFLKQLDPEGIKRIINLMLEFGYLKQEIKLEDIMY